MGNHVMDTDHPVCPFRAISSTQPYRPFRRVREGAVDVRLLAMSPDRVRGSGLRAPTSLATGHRDLFAGHDQQGPFAWRPGPPGNPHRLRSPLDQRIIRAQARLRAIARGHHAGGKRPHIGYECAPE
jgi:hypothetical protein